STVARNTANRLSASSRARSARALIPNCRDSLPSGSAEIVAIPAGEGNRSPQFGISSSKRGDREGGSGGVDTATVLSRAGGRDRWYLCKGRAVVVPARLAG